MQAVKCMEIEISDGPIGRLYQDEFIHLAI